MPATRRRFDDTITVEGCQMVLVEDSFISRVWDGDIVLGWGGDERLAVYLDLQAKTWNLFRLCDDGSLECLTRFAATIPTADIPGRIVLWLVQHDSHLGFTTEAVHAHNERLEDAHWAALEEWAVEEMSPRVVHAVQKEL